MAAQQHLSHLKKLQDDAEGSSFSKLQAHIEGFKEDTMADVRVNGRRIPPLQSVDNLATLIDKLESLADKNESALTALSVNQTFVDIENQEYRRMRIEAEDTIDAQFETPKQLSAESLRVALEMADLVLQDLKITTIKLWDNNLNYEKSLDTLLHDCNLFISLAARPIYLLNVETESLENSAQQYVAELDRIANHLENTAILSAHGRRKEACQVLIGIVKTSIERWINLSTLFAQHLDIHSEKSIHPANSNFLQENQE